MPRLHGATNVRVCPDIIFDLVAGVFVGLHRRIRLIKLQQTSC
jgi:hypothetical protein